MNWDDVGLVEWDIGASLEMMNVVCILPILIRQVVISTFHNEVLDEMGRS